MKAPSLSRDRERESFLKLLTDCMFMIIQTCTMSSVTSCESSRETDVKLNAFSLRQQNMDGWRRWTHSLKSRNWIWRHLRSNRNTSEQDKELTYNHGSFIWDLIFNLNQSLFVDLVTSAILQNDAADTKPYHYELVNPFTPKLIIQILPTIQEENDWVM